MTCKTILLVENNPDDQLLTIRALKKNNLKNHIVLVEDGREALDYLFGEGKYEDRDVSDMPTVILLDLKLPKINGLGVLKQVREHERTKLIPVVILTSSIEESDLIDSYNIGANSFISKPVDSKDFIKAVSQLELYWTVHNKVIHQ
ncbi:MAG: response regulator [Methylococcaceae bacterium]